MNNWPIFSATLAFSFVTLMTLLVVPLRADVLTVIDADTMNSFEWTPTTVFLSENVDSLVTAERFGAQLQESSTMFHDGLAAAETRRALEFNALSFEPSLKGAIVGIDYMVEHDRPATFFSHPFRVTLVQNARFYSYFGAGEHRDNSNDSTFTQFSSSSTQATDWHEVTSLDVDDETSNPDFSVSGSPITIAVMPRHGGSGVKQSFRSHFRNFSVTFRTALTIDIKPGIEPNSINLCSRGAVPIAIHGSDTFNVQDIDTETLRFADASIKIVGKKDPHSLCSFEDVNGDMIDDLVCHYLTQDIAALGGESTLAELKGELFDGTVIEGTDSVNIVKDTCM